MPRSRLNKPKRKTNSFKPQPVLYESPQSYYQRMLQQMKKLIPSRSPSPTIKPNQTKQNQVKSKTTKKHKK